MSKNLATGTPKTLKEAIRFAFEETGIPLESEKMIFLEKTIEDFLRQKFTIAMLTFNSPVSNSVIQELMRLIFRAHTK